MNENKSRIGVLIIILLTFLSFIPLRNLKFDFKTENFFPDKDPDLVFFLDFQERFKSSIDDEYIFIGLKNNRGIFDSAFLKKTDSLTKFVSKLESITKLYSLTSSNLMYMKGDELNVRPLLRIDSPYLYKTDSSFLFRSPEYRDLLVSNDGKSIAIAAFNKQLLTDHQKDALLDSIHLKLKGLGFDKTYLTAKIRVEREYAREIEKNLRVYLLLSLVLISAALFFLFRSVRVIILPLIAIAISILWTMSFISLTGHSLDIISSLLPPILAAICMSDIVHISTHYIEKIREGYPKMEALNKTYKEIGLATFFTCCTVAAGFITLGITDIIPIRNFGFFAAIGLFFAFAISMVSLYFYYANAPVPAIAYKKSSDRIWNKFVSSCFRFVLKNKLLVIVTLMFLMAGSVYYLKKIEINSSLLQEIPKKNPMLEDYRFMETDFSGTRPFEMALTITTNNTSFYEPATLRKVEETEKFLKDSCGVGYIISPVSLFKGANKAFNEGKIDSFVLPSSAQTIARYQEAIFQTDFADAFRHYLADDGRQLRVSGRLPNLSVKEFEPLKEKISHFFAARKDLPFSFQITGSAILIDKLTYSLTNNLLTGLVFDTLIICLIAFFLLRNWVATVIILIPNILPLIFMAGVMGFMGINLKADTSVIFAIALGLSVDDSIHFLTRLRLELSRGSSVPYAVKRTYLSTGKAIIITTLVLLCGFLILLSSSFGGAFYIGLLISLCLFFAMLMELTITPLLMLFWVKRTNGSKSNS